MVNPNVSIIMANYNGARYLRPALESVLAQTHTSWELLLTDDGSSDNSVEVASEIAASDSRIRIIRNSRNSGAGAARNRALEHARGDWIAVMDSDDLMRPDRIEALVRRAEADGAELIADNLAIFSEDQNKVRSYLNTRFCSATRWIDLTTFVASGTLYSRWPDLGYLKPMIRTDVLRSAGLRYNERLRIGEDYNFLSKFLCRGTRLRLDPSCMYMYRRHPGSVSHRMTEQDIIVLLEAESDFLREATSLTPRERAALKERRRTLMTLLAYERLVSVVKEGDLRAAIVSAVRNPRIWPLVGRPIWARCQRIMRQFGETSDLPSNVL